jgi:CBS domain-containing protein
MPNNVASILQRKTKKIISIAPSSTILEALQIMADKNIGSLIVMEADKYLGIISERDYSRKVALMGKHSHDTLVSEIMNTDTPTVTPNQSIDDCMDLVSKLQARYLPVLEDGKVLGIISILDLVEATSLMHKESAEELRNYISGS